MKKSIVILLLLFATNSLANEPKVWSINSRTQVLRGDAKGVSISSTGAISVAPKFSEVFDTGQPYIWSSAIDKSGNIFLGTGGEGKIFRVDQNGVGKIFVDTNELNVSALAFGRDGSLYAGTSPDGKVYKIDSSGAATVYFAPKEKYIWSIAVLQDGSLAIGTGETGKIYRVQTANADPKSTLLFDSSDTNIVSLLADDKGNVYAGTDPNGYVLSIDSNGKAFAVLDSQLTELHALAFGADGSIYALAIGENSALASTVNASAPPQSISIGVAPAVSNPPKTASNNSKASGARSAVFRIQPNGESDVLWRSNDANAFSIRANESGNGVLVGTADRGRIFDVRNDGSTQLLLQTDQDQISNLFSAEAQLFATTSNIGKLYSVSNNQASQGEYVSYVLDAGSVASWGEIWWRGNGNIKLQTRSGNTAKPNELWSAWADMPNGNAGKITSPKAQFLQWRAILTGSDSILYEVSASYIQKNIAPEVRSVEVLSSNIGLAPSPEIFIDPNISSALTPNQPGLSLPAPLPRRIPQIGARSFMWQGSDRNADKLTYSVYFRRIDEPNFRLLRANLSQSYFSIDGLSLADGRYQIKVVASDSPTNPVGLSLTGEMISEPFDIDNTPPEVKVINSPILNGNSVTLIFEASENESRIDRAEFSVDGGEWKTVYADDGISDSKNERYTVKTNLEKPGEYTIGMRVFDVNGNSGTKRVTVKR